APVEQTLARLARMVEGFANDFHCSILLVSPDGFRLHVGAAPHLPVRFVSALDGLPADELLKTAVVIPDIAVDSHFEVPRESALAEGLRAWWSVPVSGPADEVAIGVVTFHSRLPREPGEFERRLLDRCRSLAGIAIE